MDIESYLRESRAENLLPSLGFQTETGKTQFKHQLRKFSPNLGVLKRRQETILSLQRSLTPDLETEVESIFQEIHQSESELDIFFERSEVETNSYEQLLFSGWPSLQVLNTIPFVLLALAIFKQFIVPALAILSPMVMVIMPYVLLNVWYSMPITVSQYVKFLLTTMGLQNLDLTNPRTIFQGGLTLFSLGQSIYQPIQNALHLQTIHTTMMKKAAAVQRLVQHVKRLHQVFPSYTPLKYSLHDMEEQDIHQLFATFWDSPYRLRLALTAIGDCEVVYRIAKADTLNPVEFLSGPKPFLQISQGLDPFLNSAIPFDICLTGKKHHAILTGPNRGGKSSVLRSTLLNIVLAQTFGMASGSVQLRPFDWIATGLRLEDRPGSTSMFESEVEFATQILQRTKDHPEQIGLVIFDELFHSTNPPDGERTADIFLQKLWKTPNTASFISTHVFELAKKAHPTIQKLCVPAHRKEDGTLQFTYTLTRGICEVSSVDEILREKGLLDRAEKLTPENPRQ